MVTTVARWLDKLTSNRVATGQGNLQIGQGNFKYQESQGKVREFHNFGPKYVL